MGEFNEKDGVSLKEYFDVKLEALDDKMELVNRLNDTAIHKAEISVNTRLEGMNEFRAAMKDQAAKYVSKDELCLQLESLENRLKVLELDRARLEGVASQTTVLIFSAISIVGFVLTVVNFFTK